MEVFVDPGADVSIHPLERTHPVTSPSSPRRRSPWTPAATGAFREAERYRLRSLERCGLLDSGDEERFDHLTRRAQAQFGVMASAISLITEDRLYLKSLAGVLPGSIPRDASICTVTIRDEEPLVVPDLSKDELFAQNSYVVGVPFLRFYAGVPLRGPGGWFVGTFCLLGTEPRELDPRERLGLDRLAEDAELEINAVRGARP